MKLKLHDRQILGAAPTTVVFDLDNTLYAYDPAHRAGMKAVENKLSIRLGFDPARIRKDFDVAKRRVKSRLDGTASSHNRLLYFQALLEQMGLNAQVLLTLDLEQTYWRAFLANASIFPDALDFVHDLKSADVRTALFTDLTAQIQFRKLVFFGIDQMFDVVVTSEEAGRDKPAREVFDLLLEKLHLKSVTDAWLVGDNPTADIGGARAVGLRTAQKLHSGVEPATPPADVSFEHFIDMRRLWKKHFGVGEIPSRFEFKPAVYDSDYG